MSFMVVEMRNKYKKFKKIFINFLGISIRHLIQKMGTNKVCFNIKIFNLFCLTEREWEKAFLLKANAQKKS